MGSNFKFINAEYPIHTPVEAALKLAIQHDIEVDNIESVHIGMPSNSVKILESRGTHNVGVQDMVCAALVQGGLTLRKSPFPDILGNPSFVRIRPRTTLQVNQELDLEQPNGRGAIVTITIANGSSFSMRVDNPKGHSLRGGVTWSDLATKWQEGLPECDIDRMISMAQRLDKLGQVSELLDTVSERISSGS